MNKLATMKRGYNTPLITLYEVKVEAGFEASLPGTEIAPWESDNDSLEF